MFERDGRRSKHFHLERRERERERGRVWFELLRKDRQDKTRQHKTRQDETRQLTCFSRRIAVPLLLRVVLDRAPSTTADHTYITHHTYISHTTAPTPPSHGRDNKTEHRQDTHSRRSS